MRFRAGARYWSCLTHLAVTVSLPQAASHPVRRIFLEQPPLLARQLTRAQQIRAPRSSPERLPSPPALDLGVVAAEQHRRHRPSLPHLGPRVVRPVEEPGRERLVFRRPAQPSVPGSNLAMASISISAGSSPPESTRSPTDTVSSMQHSTKRSSTPSHRPATSTRPDSRASAATRAWSTGRPSAARWTRLAPGTRRTRKLDRLPQRLGLHHHPAAAVGPVVHCPMQIDRELPRIDRFHRHVPGDRAPEHAERESLGHEPGTA